MIKSNTNRFQKDFIGFKPENGAVEYIVTEEKKDEILKIYSRIKKLLNDGENPADIAVLFRTNRQAEKWLQFYSGIRYLFNPMKNSEQV